MQTSADMLKAVQDEDDFGDNMNMMSISANKANDLLVTIAHAMGDQIEKDHEEITKIITHKKKQSSSPRKITTRRNQNQPQALVQSPQSQAQRRPTSLSPMQRQKTLRNIPIFRSVYTDTIGLRGRNVCHRSKGMNDINVVIDIG